jgi:hypothetical protein
MKKDVGIPLRNPKKRELSPFIAGQLLYDYATKKIDPLREKAVAEALQNSPELAKSLDDIIYGMTYCHHLQKTTVTPEFLERFKAPPNWRVRIKRYRNLRHWNQSTAWILESVGISLVILLLSLAVPWPKYLKLFLQKQNPSLFISEVPKDSSFQTPTVAASPQPSIVPGTDFHFVAELHSVNPEFTTTKLNAALPGLGASIEHHSLRKSTGGHLVPFLRLSIPTSQTEALFSELKSQGQLTWITPPVENEKGSTIFGMELWVIKKEPPKGIAPTKDKNGE